MKKANWLFTCIAILVLLVLPLQTVQAKSAADGPIIGNSYTLKSSDTLNQDLVVIGGSVSIEKNAVVKGSVVLVGGSLTLDGEVTKDVVVFGGAVSLGPETHIRGNLVTFGGPVQRDASAKVDGDVVNNLKVPSSPLAPVAPKAPETSPMALENPIFKALGILGQSIILALLAMLIAMFMPIHLRRVADSVSGQPYTTFGLGLLSVIFFIMVLVALVIFSFFIITLILTIPLIIVVCIIFSAACVLGWLALGVEVGLRTSQMFKREWPLPLAAGLGVFILNLVAQGVGFIPCIGGLFSAVLGLAGLGAVVMTRFGVKQSQFVQSPLAANAGTPEQKS